MAETVATASQGVLRPEVRDQGLHMIAWLRGGVAQEIRRQAKVEAVLFSETLMRPAATEGFVLGFSGYDEDALRSAATSLATTALRLVGAKNA